MQYLRIDYQVLYHTTVGIDSTRYTSVSYGYTYTVFCSYARVRGTILRKEKENTGLIDTKYDTRTHVWAKLRFTKFWSNKRNPDFRVPCEHYKPKVSCVDSNGNA